MTFPVIEPMDDGGKNGLLATKLPVYVSDKAAPVIERLVSLFIRV